MAKKSKISWTDSTFNPWWGCEKVSPACDACYAERDAKRYGFSVWGKGAPRRFLSDNHWDGPLHWDAAAAAAGKRHKVFCASMADVFEDRSDLDPHRARLWKLIEATPNLDWLLLTKRPALMKKKAPWKIWPDHVWAGVTAEDQHWWDHRVPLLMQVPAKIRFVSVEPMFGPIRMRGTEEQLSEDLQQGKLSWVILGGESGSNPRPTVLSDLRHMLGQCVALGVKPFVKQLGAVWAKENESKTAKADDPKEWPEDLQIQEFPEVKHAS